MSHGFIQSCSANYYFMVLHMDRRFTAIWDYLKSEMLIRKKCSDWPFYDIVFSSVVFFYGKGVEDLTLKKKYNRGFTV